MVGKGSPDKVGSFCVYMAGLGGSGFSQTGCFLRNFATFWSSLSSIGRI